MQFPSEKPHRVQRRRLGRGQYARPAPVTVAVMGAGTQIRLVFSRPVAVDGPINFEIPPALAITQTVDSETQVTITYTSLIANLPWLLPTPPAHVRSLCGQPIFGASGEFMLSPDDVLNTAGGNYFPPPDNEVADAFQFGIGNTGSTGTYVTPTPANSNPISAHNNGDGTYTIVFAFAINTNNAGILDPKIIMYDATADAWNECTSNGNFAGDTHTFTDATNSPNNTIFAVLPGVTSLVPGTHPFVLPFAIDIP